MRFVSRRSVVGADRPSDRRDAAGSPGHGRIMFATVLTVAAALFAAFPAAGLAGTVSISAHITANSVYLNAPTYAAGSVSPGNATQRVVVQRGVAGQWRDRGAGPVASDGTFKILVRPSQAGIYSLRVRSNDGAVTSQTVYLRVKSPPCTLDAIPHNHGDHAPWCYGQWGLVYPPDDPVTGDAIGPYIVRWNGATWVPVVDNGSNCLQGVIPPAVYVRYCVS